VYRLPSCTPLFSFLPVPSADTYSLSLHDALPILDGSENLPRFAHVIAGGKRLAGVNPVEQVVRDAAPFVRQEFPRADDKAAINRSEEHTSELQSRFDLVCRLLLEKKNVAEYHLAR